MSRASASNHAAPLWEGITIAFVAVCLIVGASVGAVTHDWNGASVLEDAAVVAGGW